MVKRSEEQKALEYIAHNSAEFGIKDVVGYSIKLKIKNGQSGLLAEPDIVFYCLGNVVWICEYKSNLENGDSERALNQVTTAASWFGKYTPYELGDIKTKIIHGDDKRLSLRNYFKKTNAHTKAIQIISNNPSNFGVGNEEDCIIKGHSLESRLLNERGIEICSPDLVFHCSRNNLVIVEYKGDGKDPQYQEKAQHQIGVNSAWFGKYTPYNPENIHTKIIYGTDSRYKPFLGNLR